MVLFQKMSNLKSINKSIILLTCKVLDAFQDCLVHIFQPTLPSSPPSTRSASHPQQLRNIHEVWQMLFQSKQPKTHLGPSILHKHIDCSFEGVCRLLKQIPIFHISTNLPECILCNLLREEPRVVKITLYIQHWPMPI